MIKNPEGGSFQQEKNLKRPIIGVFSQPSSKNGYSYIPSSYIKWIEAAGGKVLPILYDLPNEKLEEIFSKMNGVLLPGGGESLRRETKFMKANLKIFQLAKEENDKPNKHFPIFGTCQGFQILCIISPDVYKEKKDVSPNYEPSDVLFNCQGTRRSSLPVKFVDSKFESRMFPRKESINSPLGPYFRKVSTNENITLNSHSYGVDLPTFDETGLSKEYNIIATSVDTSGKEFISIFEHKKHPIFSVQFHPEKVAFEDKPLEINTSLNSNLFNNYLASYFVNSAKLSDHKFSYDKDKNLLIDSFICEPYPWVYFRSAYYFKNVGK